MRTLLIGDVHANAPALLALPPADRILCTGDVVGYGPHPHDVIEYLHDLRATSVRGDEDDAIGNGIAGFGPPEFEHACHEMREWTRSVLARAELNLLGLLPPDHEDILDGIHIAVVHAYPGDCGRYVEPNTEQLSHLVHAYPQAALIVFGHTHRPGIWRCGNTLVVNPGSLGQPLRPGHASFAVIEDRAIRFAEVRYDVLATMRDLSVLPLSPKAREELDLGLLRGGQRPFAHVGRLAVHA